MPELENDKGGEPSPHRRPFRGEASKRSERITRDMLPEYLAQRGFVQVRDSRAGGSQRIDTVSPDGESVSMRVRLCWRRESPGTSGTQLMSKITGDDWNKEIQAKLDRERSQGITHFLLVQRDDDRIAFAALVPIEEVLPVWTGQRKVSERLLASGRSSRRKANRAMNGSSPTLWLEDQVAPEIPNELWHNARVQDLARRKPLANALLPDELAADAPFIEGSRRTIIVNAYERDRNARDQCVAHYGVRCFICEVSLDTIYGSVAEGLIHVHHVKPLAQIGVEYVVDPVRDLRPVCPNCHAVIHRGPPYAPEEVREMIASARRARS